MGICFEKVGSTGGVGAAEVVAATDDEAILSDLESSLVLFASYLVPAC